MQKLKAAYDAAQGEEDKLLNSSEGEGEENAADDKPTEPLAKEGKSDDLKASSWACWKSDRERTNPAYSTWESIVTC